MDNRTPQKIMKIWHFSGKSKKCFDKKPYLLSSLPRNPTERSVVLPEEWKGVLVSSRDNHLQI